jgi:hypothetical protein
LQWDDITEIIAFKRDLLTTDIVCLMLRTSGMTFEINEEMTEFSQLAKELEKVFPTFDKSWWEKVVTPAFATNETIVYRRA